MNASFVLVLLSKTFDLVRTFLFCLVWKRKNWYSKTPIICHMTRNLWLTTVNARSVYRRIPNYMWCPITDLSNYRCFIVIYFGKTALILLIFSTTFADIFKPIEFYPLPNDLIILKLLKQKLLPRHFLTHSSKKKSTIDIGVKL